MTWYGLSVFSLAYILAVAIPGPGIAAIIARSLGHGLRGAPAFIGGFLVGDLIWFTCAATGLAMLAQSAYSVFLSGEVRRCCLPAVFGLPLVDGRPQRRSMPRPADVTQERPLRLFSGLPGADRWGIQRP